MKSQVCIFLLFSASCAPLNFITLPLLNLENLGEVPSLSISYDHRTLSANEWIIISLSHSWTEKASMSDHSHLTRLLLIHSSVLIIYSREFMGACAALIISDCQITEKSHCCWSRHSNAQMQSFARWSAWWTLEDVPCTSPVGLLISSSKEGCEKSTHASYYETDSFIKQNQN